MEFVDEPILHENVPTDIHVVLFDIETTGFCPVKHEICQIACKYNSQEFDVYSFPLNGIPTRISELTGLSTHDGRMFDGENPVDGESLYCSLNIFINFLKTIGDTVVLVGHNCFGFDAKFIIHNLEKTGLYQAFSSIVLDFQIFSDFRNVRTKKK